MSLTVLIEVTTIFLIVSYAVGFSFGLKIIGQANVASSANQDLAMIDKNVPDEYEESRKTHNQEQPHSPDESKEIFGRVPRLSYTIGGDLSIMCTEACRGRRCVGPPCGAILRNRKRSNNFPQDLKGLKQFCEYACQGRNCFGPPCFRSHYS